jgi:polyisoprenyl-phosphate glycosyltransferase
LLRVAIVTPVFNDWPSFRRLVSEIGAIPAAQTTFHVVAVDDGSIEEFDIDDLPEQNGGIAAIEILHLAVNLGHQRAIAVGLSDVSDREDLDYIVVMDSDGEDRPTDIPSLLRGAASHPGSIALASRARRSEGTQFQIGYRLYKTLCRLLIGQVIDFGNFCVLPVKAARRLVYMPELWNCIPAAILRSRLPCTSLACDRASRYVGSSKMNMSALVAHGLSAISVYADIAFSRLLVGTSAAGLLALVGAAVAVFLKFAANLATPGWMTSAVGVMLILLTQMALLTLNSALIVLLGRNVRGVVPVIHCRDFVIRRQKRNMAAEARKSRDSIEAVIARAANF